jgi:hypothetical protein
VSFVHTLDRLLDQTTVYLHRDASRLPEEQRGTLEEIYRSNRWLAGPQGADRRRRHAQHLRAVHGARGLRHEDPHGRQRPRRDRDREGEPTSTSC